jgi:citronellol/citronellal dehydrogenase
MSISIAQVFSPTLFAGSVAIVTGTLRVSICCGKFFNFAPGGGSGIGLGISKALASLGAHVILVGRRENVVAEAAAAIRLSGGQSMHMACDVRDKAACEEVVLQAVKRLGAVHILVNCAAGEFVFVVCAFQLRSTSV